MPAQHGINLDAAYQHFRQIDPAMAMLLRRARNGTTPVAVPTRKPPRVFFQTLARSVVSQQISTKAADAVYARVRETLDQVTPASVRHTPPETLAACGLSQAKVRFLHGIAAAWPTLPTRHFRVMSDEEIVSTLTALPGVGRWTAEMFLIFSLARPDVFSFGDLGLIVSCCAHYNLERTDTHAIARTAHAWSPHRTAAALALWYHRDNGPVLL